MKNSVKNIAANSVKNVNKVFMAFGKVSEAKEFTPAPKYIGIGNFNVVAVNPDKAKLNELGIKAEQEPNYVATSGDSFKVDVFVKSTNDVELLTKVTFWIKNEKRTNMAGDKMQVIDKYGNTAWVTPAEFTAKATTLMGKNGAYSAGIDKDYRGAYVGEEELIRFIKVYRGVKNALALVNGSWIANPKLAEQGFTQDDCLCCFDESDIAAMMKGNYTSVKSALEGIESGQIKLMVGLKTTEVDGKTRTYQNVFTSYVAYPYAKSYDKFAEALKGAHYQLESNFFKKNDYTYEVADIHEYSISATSFTQENSDMPSPEAGKAPATTAWNFAN